MQLIIFAHPAFMKSKSMPRYAEMIEKGMKARGHQVKVWTPKSFFYKIPFPASGKKWLGYIDQFLVFPLLVKKILNNTSKDTLFVFADQALGPWIPLVANKPHIIHCHDFLAQRSARGEFPQNKLKFTGKLYQKITREGFRKGENFISISEKTRKDLHNHLNKEPQVSEVIYNGINPHFKPGDRKAAQKKVKEHLRPIGAENFENGYILNVGGNSWYKNKIGVLEIYNYWKENFNTNLPLVMVGALDEDLKDYIDEKSWKKDFFQLQNVSEEVLINLYRGASVLLFPSLAEGFGWPIAEAMACGCPVITTNEAPMTEVGGKAATYISKRPENQEEVKSWAKKSAFALQDLLSKDKDVLNQIGNAGYLNIRRFDENEFLSQLENWYRKVIENYQMKGKDVSSDHLKESGVEQNLSWETNK